jgi:hypothetical protein
LRARATPGRALANVLRTAHRSRCKQTILPTILSDDPSALVHDPEKWKPVFGKIMHQLKNLDLDPIRFDRIKI